MIHKLTLSNSRPRITARIKLVGDKAQIVLQRGAGSVFKFIAPAADVCAFADALRGKLATTPLQPAPAVVPPAPVHPPAPKGTLSLKPDEELVKSTHPLMPNVVRKKQQPVA